MQANHTKYSFKNFVPLLIIFLLIITLTCLKTYIMGNWDIKILMINFMGFFFITFGAFKASNLKNFAKAYSLYDLIAQRSRSYALIYPFIELALGIAYLMQWHLRLLNGFTLLLMSLNALGVAISLSKKRDIECACLGTVFKLPMTLVTLFEDLLMLIMAVYMLY